ncbi:MAG TPA: SDR family NAD(P)-dependent oxidoreductase, partial [Bacteroidales bacterium]|nr:SDR family NAD(P)-dependent oxidoreductase [Bacteroidales bacterium]
GFGEAIAKSLAQLDYNLILTARNEAKLQKVIQEILSVSDVEVLPLIFDIQDYTACEKAIQSIPEAFKDIDVLVNNAGLAVELEKIHTGAIEDWERMINTNVKGLLYMSRLITPRMVERKKGHIINMGSISSREVYIGGNVYCATKHAVLALSQGMRMDLLPFGIKVTHVSPGAAETEFSITRFHGDTEKAKKVYEGYEPLVAADIANVVEYVVSLPDHVCINEINLTCTAQFNGIIVKKNQ